MKNRKFLKSSSSRRVRKIFSKMYFTGYILKIKRRELLGAR